MSKFVLTAQLQLQAPNNVKQVVNQIQSQLKGINVNVNVQGAQQAQTQVQNLAKSTQDAATASQKLGKNFGQAIRRFSALAIATRAVSLFTNTLGEAIRESIAFERELIKISQVTGNTIKQLSFLTKTVSDLSTGLGVSSSSLLGVSRILSQAGLSAKETETALATLAKTDLAPTFDDISQTAEGAIAIFNQFRAGAAALEEQLGAVNAVAGQFAVESGDLISVVRRTGGVFKAAGGELNELIALFTSVRSTTRESAESIATGLRTIFTRIQRPQTIEYLKKYGVELTDLEGKFVGPYEAVRRLSTALAGLEEGDITFVEIAEQLGGFRQIGKVIPLLQQFSVAQEALNVAQQGSASLAKDAATAQLSLAVQVMKVKEEFMELIRGVTATPTFQIMAQTALTLASALIKVADSLKPILPIITAIAAVKFTKGIGGFLGGIAGGLTGAKGFNAGGKVHAFATGGMVPGTGNRDTVPAMLTPGEFVIRKSSVQKLGAENLAAMNSGGEVQKFATGGKIKIKPGEIGGFFLQPEQGTDRDINIPEQKEMAGKITNVKALERLGLRDKNQREKLPTGKDAFSQLSAGQLKRIVGKGKGGPKIWNRYAGKTGKEALDLAKQKQKSTNEQEALAANSFVKSYNEPTVQREIKKEYVQSTRNVSGRDAKTVGISGTIKSFFPGGANPPENAQFANAVKNKTSEGLKNIVASVAESVNSLLNNGNLGAIKLDSSKVRAGAERASTDQGTLDTTVGYMFEGLIDSLTGAKLRGGKSTWDFNGQSISSNADALARLFADSPASFSSMKKADAKKSASSDAFSSIKEKVISDINSGATRGYEFIPKKFATGGAATGTDTVPALLTPGEFVVNKKSAQRIGYGALNRMNKVGKYAKGGVVQHFAGGGTAQSGSGGIMGMDAMTSGLIGAQMALSMLTPTIDENSSAMARMAAGGMEAMNTLVSFATTVTMASAAMKSEMAGNLLKSFKNFSAGMKATTSRSQMASQLQGLRKSAPMVQGSPFQINRKSMRQDLFKSKTIAPKGLAGKAGNLFSSGMNKLGSKLPTLAKGLGSVTKLFGTVGTSLTSFAPAIMAAAGPIAAIAAAGAVIGGMVKGFRDLDARLKTAIKTEDTAAAQSLATAKAVEDGWGGIMGGLASLFGDAGNEVLLGIGEWFGGPSAAVIKADIDARIKSSKAAKALGEASTASSKAMKDLENGTITAAEGLRQVTALTALSKTAATASNKVAEEKLGTKAGGISGGFRDFFALGGLNPMMETSTQRNRRLSGEAAESINTSTQQRLKGVQAERGLAMSTARSVFSRGGSIDDARNELQAAGATTSTDLRNEAISARKQAAKAYDAGDTEAAQAFEQQAKSLSAEARNLEKSMINLEKEVKKQKAYIAAMNLGLNTATGAAKAVSVGLSNYMKTQELGAVTIGNSFATVEAAMSTAASGISSADFGKALGDVTKTIAEYGGDPAAVKRVTSSMEATYKAQKGSEKALDNFKKKLNDQSDRGLGGQNQESQVQGLFDEIITSAGLDGTDAGKELRDKLNGLSDELDWDEINAGDFSSVQDILEKVGAEQAKQFEAIIKAEQEYQQAVRDITNKRIAAEDNLIAASKKRISVELEAAEIKESAGGPTVTASMRSEFNRRQANVGVDKIAGVSELQDTSVASLKKRQSELSAAQARQGAAVNESARTGEAVGGGGAGGMDFGAEQQRTAQAGQQLYNTIKTEIAIRQKEVKLIQEKNKLEKQGIESLMSGDIEGFFEAQSTQGAMAAIAGGGNLGDFDADSLNKAYQELKRLSEAGVKEFQGQKIGGPGGLLQKASAATLEARGLDPAQAAMMSQGVGPSAEEQKLNNEIQQYADLLAPTVDLEMQAANLQIQAANLQLAAAGEVKNKAIAEAQAKGGAAPPPPPAAAPAAAGGAAPAAAGATPAAAGGAAPATGDATPSSSLDATSENTMVASVGTPAAVGISAAMPSLSAGMDLLNVGAQNLTAEGRAKFDKKMQERSARNDRTMAGGAVEGFLNPVEKIIEGGYTVSDTMKARSESISSARKTKDMAMASVDATGLEVRDRTAAREEANLRMDLQAAKSSGNVDEQARIEKQLSDNQAAREQRRGSEKGMLDWSSNADPAEFTEYVNKLVEAMKINQANQAAGATKASATQSGTQQQQVVASGSMTKAVTATSEAAAAKAGESGGFDSSAMKEFTNALNKFNDTILESIKTLQSTSFTVKLEPTTVNINLNGTSFLQTMTTELQNKLMGLISQRFRNLRVDSNGRVVESSSEV